MRLYNCRVCGFILGPLPEKSVEKYVLVACPVCKAPEGLVNITPKPTIIQKPKPEPTPTKED